MVQDRQWCKQRKLGDQIRTKDFLACLSEDDTWYIQGVREHLSADGASQWLANHGAEGLRRQFFDARLSRLVAADEPEAWALIFSVQQAFNELAVPESKRPCLSPSTYRFQ